MACLFGHKWKGCKCERCGKVRDHDYQNVPGKCYDVCRNCGEENRNYMAPNYHQVVYHKEKCAEICSVCGEKVQTKHDYVKVPGKCYMVCSVCGDKHWDVHHTWKNVPGKCQQKCEVCGATEPLEHHWEKGFCAVCGQDINKPEIGCIPPLIWHSAEGHVDQVRALIAGGADVNICTDETALIAAARHGHDENHLETMRLLIQAGAYVNAVDRYGSSAVRIAQRKGLTKAVQLLQQHGGVYRGA